MKKKLLTMLSGKVILASIVAGAVFTVIISSCTKSGSTSSSPNYATQYVGSWTVTSSTCGSGAAAVIINAGSGSNALATSGTVGSGSCVKPITENGTASANSFSFPAQTFTDGCSNSYTISISGTVSGNTMTATETVSGAVNASCTFTATK